MNKDDYRHPEFPWQWNEYGVAKHAQIVYWHNEEHHTISIEVARDEKDLNAWFYGIRYIGQQCPVSKHGEKFPTQSLAVTAAYERIKKLFDAGMTYGIPIRAFYFGRLRDNFLRVYGERNQLKLF